MNVTNLEKSKQFYQDLFGWKELGSDSKLGYAFFSDGKNMFTLWQQGTTPYSKGSAGLHHFALVVEGSDALTLAEQILRKKRVRIHYDRIVPSSEGAKESEIYFYDPDGIRVELFSTTGGEGRQAPLSHAPSCYLPD